MRTLELGCLILRQIGRLAIPVLLAVAAGFVRRHSGFCAIAFKPGPGDAGTAPASFGASFKANAQNPELRRTKPAASRAEADGRGKTLIASTSFKPV